MQAQGHDDRDDPARQYSSSENEVFSGLCYLFFKHSEGGKLEFLNVFISRKRKQLSNHNSNTSDTTELES